MINTTMFTLILLNLILITNSYAGINSVGINEAACSYNSISAAILASSSGDTIYIEQGTYNELLETIDGKDLTFVPAESGCKAELMSGNSGSVRVDGGGGSVDAIGGLVEITNGSVVTFRHMLLSNATAADFGGIIAVTNASELTLDDADVLGGFTNGDGGNIYVSEDVMANLPSKLKLLNNSSIYNGEATLGNGGGVALKGSILTIDNGNIGISETNKNIATNDGGGIHAIDSTINLTSIQARVSWNQAANYGGGIYAINSILNVTGAVINDNKASLHGGGLHLDHSNLTMADALISKNQTIVNLSYGGGLYNLYSLSGVTTINNTTFDQNSAVERGGGFHIVSIDGVISNSVFSNNNTTDSFASGAGGYIDNSIRLNILNSEFTNNSSTGDGGGLFVRSSTDTTIEQSIFTGNTAGRHGGGFFSFADENLALIGTTINNNTSTSEGGGIAIALSSVDIINSEVRLNHANGRGGGIVIDASGYFAAHLFSKVNIFTENCNTSGSNYCSQISNNTAEGFGGGIYMRNNNSGGFTSELTINSTTLNDNISHMGGSVLYMQPTGVEVASAMLENVLISSNGNSTYETTVVEAQDNSILAIDSATVVSNFGNPLWITDSFTTIDITNSILYQNTIGPFVDTNVFLTHSCNNVQVLESGSQSLGNNLGNPSFDANFRLNAGSPSLNQCIDGPFQDLDGLYRPDMNGGIYDQGAFERDGLLVRPEEVFANGFE